MAGLGCALGCCNSLGLPLAGTGWSFASLFLRSRFGGGISGTSMSGMDIGGFFDGRVRAGFLMGNKHLFFSSGTVYLLTFSCGAEVKA